MKVLANILFCFFLFIKVCLSQNNFWYQTNGPTRTSCYSFCFPNNQSILAGTLEKGVFHSTDNGDSWNQTSLKDATINCFIIDPIFGEIYAGADNGIYVSTDDGNTWIHKQYFGRVMSFTMNSFGQIYAGCLGSGVWTKTGTDTLWTNIGLSNTSVWSLAVYGEYLFAGCGGTNGVWRTTNNGLIWEPVDSGLNHLDVRDLIINSMGYIFVTTVYGGVYRSIDFGAHWMQMNNGLSFTNFVWSPAINSNGHIFVGTDGQQRGVYRSTDFGSSWNLVGLSGFDIITLGINSNNQIYGGSVFNKVFRSSDNGNNWLLVGLPDTYVLSLASKTNGYLFAGTKEYGIYRSTNNGEEWDYNHFDGDDINAIKINSNGFIYVGTAGRGIHISTNNGENWTKASFFVLGNDSVNCIGINSSGHIFAGTDGYGIYRTTNYGIVWNQINNGLTNLDIRCIVLSSDDKLFSGTYGGGIFYSSNNGNNWIQINNGLSNQNVNSLAINPTNGNLFSGTWGSGVFRSTDQGSNWTQINNGLNDLKVYSIVINSNGYIFSSTQSGNVYLSVDNGNNWIEISSGLINISDVYSLCLDLDNFLYAGSSGSGVYRSNYPITGFEETIYIRPNSFVLYQNYPNPFNPSTLISYQLPVSSDVTLKVYDVLGNEIATLVDEYKSAGRYEVEFNETSLPSGVYFYQLKAGDFIQTRKMILLK